MGTIWRLKDYGTRYKWRLIASALAMFASTVSVMVVPRILGEAIDQALATGLRSRLLVMAAIIVGISVATAVFGYLRNYLAESVSQRACYDLRNDFFRKLQDLSFGFHDRQQTGDLMSRATSDVEAVRWFFRMGIIGGLSTVVMVAAVSGLMLVTNWRLAMVAIAFVPLVMWRAVAMAGGLVLIWLMVQIETGKMTAVLQENLSGIRIVRAFGARKHEESKFEEKAAALSRHTYSSGRILASQGSLMTFIFTAATAVILWLGGREIASGRLTEGELVAFVLYMGILAMPVRMTGWTVNIFSWATSAGQRLYEVLDAESPVTERPGAAPLDRVDGRVTFEHVSMTYEAGIPAVQDVDLDVQPGQLVALLGTPGSGKSTIVHLVPRFYDVSEGHVLIDGLDVRDITISSLRANVGIVMQDVFVFAASIRENIAYGAADASLEDVVRAAKVAQLHDFIESLPMGYETPVGERGANLSGGQRQRLAIARTVLLNPPILILDDSTSSVDVGTEHEIQEALSHIVKRRTTFVIAHRLSTVRDADLILVLDQGRIVERGTHGELLARNGFYRRIHDLQLKPAEADVLPDIPSIAAGDDS